MKKLILAFVCLFAGLAQSFAAEVIVVKKTYDLRDFNQIEVSNSYELTIKIGPTYSVTVEASEELETALQVTNVDGTLVFGLGKTQVKLKKPILRAVVEMPALLGLSTAGAAKVTIEDELEVPNSFTLKMAGASKLVKGIVVDAQTLTVNTSGAAEAGINTHSIEVNITASGASNLAFDAEMTDLNLDLSGTAVLNWKAGSVENLNLNVSGASAYMGEGIPAKVVNATVSGSSNAKVFVKETLTAKCTGASTFTYYTAGDINIKDIEVARASTLKHVSK